MTIVTVGANARVVAKSISRNVRIGGKNPTIVDVGVGGSLEVGEMDGNVTMAEVPAELWALLQADRQKGMDRETMMATWRDRITEYGLSASDLIGLLGRLFGS